MKLEVIEKRATEKRYELPLLFVHGGGASASCWDAFQTYFAEAGFDTYALSLRGHGKSPAGGILNLIGFRHTFRCGWVGSASHINRALMGRVSGSKIPCMLFGLSSCGVAVFTRSGMGMGADLANVQDASVPGDPGAPGFLSSHCLQSK